MSKRSSVSTGVGPAEGHGQRTGPPGSRHRAVLVLGDAVEEHGEEPTVDQSRRALEDEGEGDGSGRRLGVEMVEAVFRKARIESADVERMAEVDAFVVTVGVAPRRAVRRYDVGELAFPGRELREHRVDGRVGVFEARAACR